MLSVNLRQLRDTRQIKEWLKQGEVIELRERDRVLGHITPEAAAGPKEPKEWPDFAARRKRIFGDRVFDDRQQRLAEAVGLDTRS